MTLLSQFHFKGRQEQAAASPNHAIAVTAGAGSGKTLSLVGRYLHLLERGYPLRSILAITFTEKAAREMRSRIRSALSHVSPDSTQDDSSSFILHLSSLDSARIGTIHSLCAEILRAHPAEARLDPAFEVLEEGLAAALQAEAIEAALAWASTDEQSAALFGLFKENELRQVLGASMSRRLDVYSLLPLGEGLGMREKFAFALASHLATQLDSDTWLDSLSTLASHTSASLEDKLELARQAVLAHWAEIQQARAAQNWDALLIALAALRKASSTQGKKENWADIEAVRAAMTGLRQIYDDHLRFLAEKSRFALDEQLAAHLPAVHRLLDQILLEYQRHKDERQSLDFDDLEDLTAQLLTGHPEIRAGLQSELCAVLVDEFQDTNERQRQIVYALTGFSPHPGPLPAGEGNSLPPLGEGPGMRAGVDLFLVGDAKQSIYRFRSADVTVFRQVQADIQNSGGQLLDLDLTFRAHKALLENLNALLAPILGESDDPARPYVVPFAPLRAYRQNPVRENIQPPFVEFHLGLGESAEEGRASAASALARRLRQLHETEGFAWGEMALLFRSSTAFPVYEAALEAADIPFVTVAGRGFYDRPEIRDLLNILAAIADPTDDLALVGLLRSPAFALPDAEIYRLRFPNPASSRPAKLIDSLRNTQNATVLSILTDLHSLAGRASAAVVLKRLLDLTHYRAILSSAPNGARMVRNVEKLLADAHRSRLVSLTDFLAYVQTLRDVGLREGEAPADPSTGSGGAVQLMTVHKAKGLEFPITVLADAAYEHRGSLGRVQLADGLLLDLRDDEFHTTAWQLASRLEDDRAEAEDNRLLYVAATRAKEKLIVSGHVKRKKDGMLSLAGWLGKFGLDQIQIAGEMSTPQQFPLNNGLAAVLYPVSAVDVPPAPQPDSVSIGSPLPVGEGLGVRADLLEPLAPATPVIDEKTRTRESDPPQRVWRIVSKAKTPRAPAWLVGRLVHEALRRWHLHDETFEDFLRPFAIESGLTDLAEIHAAIQESRRLLDRLRVHPLFTELDTAERHHEIRYDLPTGRGIIDLLYRTEAGWFIIDFKTDEVRSKEEAQSVIRQNGYNAQVARYAEAIADLLGVRAKMRLVFLNVNNTLTIFDL
jgi:ATP-dependent exoDNAse (exonuclease V) beta subunit